MGGRKVPKIPDDGHVEEQGTNRNGIFEIIETGSKEMRGDRVPE